jgi:tRNA modification GTPase
MYSEDTIAALATPPGEGGIGIVRLSGPAAAEIAAKIFKPRKAVFPLKSHRLYLGRVYDPGDGQAVDEVLLTVMYAPRTFTREDVVEINGHGGIVPLRRILEIVLDQGARLAEPGEFTRRAFLNGRLDLAQAEALLQVIRSKTDTGLKTALGQLEGTLSRRIGEIRREILLLLARLEAALDFPEEAGVEDLGGGQVKQAGAALLEQLKELAAGAGRGKIYRDGVETVIVGRPNVGKSSLLNALLREERAIVTDVAGTTRDQLEEYVNLRGIPLKMVDTAGIRKTRNQVEIIGVERARHLAQRGDLILFMLNAAEGITGEDREIASLLQGKPVLVLLNKMDLGAVITAADVRRLLGEETPVIPSSLIQGQGLQELEEAIVRMVLGGRVEGARTEFLASLRQTRALERAVRHLEEMLAGELEDPDLLSIDLQAAYGALGEITGETVTEDLLDTIFAEFCIGK